jgi:hypothetical protein
MDKDRIMLKPAEAAELLGFNIGTLAQWRLNKVGPKYIKLGSGLRSPIRYYKDDVIAYMNKNTVDHSQEAEQNV